jgi:2-dehydro-3-deoxy-D-arabinonate dehydratase
LKFCRFQSPYGIHLGVVQDGQVHDLTSVDPVVFADLNSLHAASETSHSSMSAVAGESLGASPSVPYDEALLRIPLVPAEIWGAGVTYLKSRAARESETKTKGLYDYVYDAERPELFLKDTGVRCRGPGETVHIRGDSRWSVPEPELTVVFDRALKVLGYTIGNDVSSRDIEGENPLYLPQAKIYSGSSAIGPVVVSGDEVSDPHSLAMGMRILRGGRVQFEGRSNTSQMKRKIDELARFLGRDNDLRTFTLLMTGTPIVPPDEFALQDGDVIEIEIEKIGLLRNPVRKLA